MFVRATLLFGSTYRQTIETSSVAVAVAVNDHVNGIQGHALGPARRRDAHEDEIEEGGQAEADEPGVVEEARKAGQDRAGPGDRASGERRDRRMDVPAAVVPVAALMQVEVLEREALLSHAVVVGDEHARDRAE